MSYTNQSVPTNKDYNFQKIIQSNHDIASQLNDSFSTKRGEIQMNQNAFGKYVNKPEQVQWPLESSQGFSASRKDVLSTIINPRNDLLGLIPNGTQRNFTTLEHPQR